MPPHSITDDEADEMVEPHVETERLDELRRRVAAARAMAAMNDNVAVAPVQDEPFFPSQEIGWYRVVGPAETTISFASGTSDDAQAFYDLAPDGWTLDAIEEGPDTFALNLAAKTPGSTIAGKRLTALEDEVEDWRSERSSAYR